MVVIPAIRILTDATFEQIDVDTSQLGSVLGLCDAVGAERVDVVQLSDQVEMWLDDGIYSTPLNLLASLYAAEYGYTHQDYFGTAVITGGVDEDGETRGLDHIEAVSDRLAAIAKLIKGEQR